MVSASLFVVCRYIPQDNAGDRNTGSLQLLEARYGDLESHDNDDEGDETGHVWPVD